MCYLIKKGLKDNICNYFKNKIFKRELRIFMEIYVKDLNKWNNMDKKTQFYEDSNSTQI